MNAGVMWAQALWLARDKGGALFLYKDRPRRGRRAWHGKVRWCCCDDSQMGSVRWEDEPQRVEVTMSKLLKETNQWKTDSQ